jgi:hypothetical protein
VLTGGPFVGEPFMVYEPGLVTSTLGDHTPILMLQNSPLLPLKVLAGQMRSTEASMTIPSNVGETNYFVLTGKEIVISAVKLYPEQSCFEIQCGRQKVAQKGGCTCLHATSHLALVYVCNVTFDVPKKVDSNGQVTVLEFCSLKTTKLFYRNFDEYVSRHSMSDLRDSNQAYQTKWMDVTGYINGHGGWTLAGWFMFGDHGDAANPHEKVQNFQTALHLLSLQPTNVGVLAEEAYKGLCIDNSTLTSVHTNGQIQIDVGAAVGAVAGAAASAAGALGGALI